MYGLLARTRLIILRGCCNCIYLVQESCWMWMVGRRAGEARGGARAGAAALAPARGTREKAVRPSAAHSCAGRFTSDAAFTSDSASQDSVCVQSGHGRHGNAKDGNEGLHDLADAQNRMTIPRQQTVFILCKKIRTST